MEPTLEALVFLFEEHVKQTASAQALLETPRLDPVNIPGFVA